MKKVTISRYWNRPEINITVNDELISLNMKMDDFIKALKEEIGSVTWMFRDKTFNETMDNAVQSVIKKVKEESVKVMK
jgi:hypothetical protein